ncbi:MAG: hypothetical protein WC390_11615 [Sulfurimonas sp.]|jgi:hypothetical protein
MACDKLSIDPDSIIGSPRNGGHIFSVDVQFGGFEAPSTLTVQIINKTGNYSLPMLPQGDKFYKKLAKERLNIGGGYYFNGYLVSYTLTKKAEQKILSLKFRDGSVALDQLAVGMNALWGDKNKNKADDLLIIGRNFNPCDKNGDSLISFDEANSEGSPDNCSPCLGCQNDQSYADRCKVSEYMILPVKYGFHELIQSLSSHNINVVNAKSFNKLNSNANSFTGSLRSVLSSWCQEYGLTFYWDYNTDSLVFVDLGVDVKIDFDKYINLDNIDEYTQTESIEETYSQGVISYYERAGELKDYQCTDNAIINLRPLTYADLLDKDLSSDYINLREISLALSYYSSTLREIYWWFYCYGIKGPQQAETYLYDQNAAQKSSSADAQDAKVLHELAGMKILQVASQSNENQGDFETFANILSDEKKETLRSLNEIYSKSHGAGSLAYYFIIAEFDDQLLAKQYSEEANLAQNYLGKYWIRQYNPNLCCGASRYSDVNVKAPDGTANFYQSFSNINGLGFTSFGYNDNSYVASVVANATESEDQQPETNEKFGKTYRVNGSFIEAERSPKWYPNSAQLSDYAALFDYYQNNLNFALVGDGGRPPDLLTVYPAAKQNPNIRLLLCNIGQFDGERLPISVSNINNFLEVRNQTQVFTTQFNKTNVGDPQEEIEVAKMGLTSRECMWITLDGFQFMTPVGGVIFAESNFQTSSAYRVLVTQNTTQQVEIPKIQNSYITSVVNRGFKNEYLYKPIDSNSINIFNEGSCTPSEETLRQIHNDVTKYLGTEKVWPAKSVEFSMAGVIPYTVTIEDGLENFTISIGDNGVFTRYRISSRYAQPITDSIYQNIIKNIYQKLLTNPTVPPYKIKPQTTYPII